MMFFLLAKNTDQVIFSQIMEVQRYPDYDHEAEPLDVENRRLNKYHEDENSQTESTEKPETNILLAYKKRFNNRT